MRRPVAGRNRQSAGLSPRKRRTMSTKLIGALIAGSLLVLPAGVQASRTPHKNAPMHRTAADKKPITAPAPACEGTISQCPGFKFMCRTAFYPKMAAVFTNSDAVEDWYEAVTI